MAVRLDWEDKPKQVERLSLPFQTVETINESRATRERDEGSLLSGASAAPGRNLLAWGDNQLVMSSLLADFAGHVRLIYIDPPFDTGADFSFTAAVPDAPTTPTPTRWPSPRNPALSSRRPTATPGDAGWIRTCNGSMRP